MPLRTRARARVSLVGLLSPRGASIVAAAILIAAVAGAGCASGGGRVQQLESRATTLEARTADLLATQEHVIARLVEVQTQLTEALEQAAAARAALDELVSSAATAGQIDPATGLAGQGAPGGEEQGQAGVPADAAGQQEQGEVGSGQEQATAGAEGEDAPPAEGPDQEAAAGEPGVQEPPAPASGSQQAPTEQPVASPPATSPQPDLGPAVASLQTLVTTLEERLAQITTELTELRASQAAAAWAQTPGVTDPVLHLVTAPAQDEGVQDAPAGAATPGGEEPPPDAVERPTTTVAPRLLTTGGVSASGSGLNEDALYRQAYVAYVRAEYTTAIDSFNEFVLRFTNSFNAASAMYWLAESYTASGEHVEALQAFKQLRDQFPGSIIVPDAILRSAQVTDLVGQRDRAVRELLYLIVEHPTADAVSIACQQLGVWAVPEPPEACERD